MNADFQARGASFWRRRRESAPLFAQTNGGGVPQRALGKTGAQVSALGLGGFHLGSAKDVNEARQIVDMALDAGINFFDNAWEYHDGRSEEWLGQALNATRHS